MKLSTQGQHAIMAMLALAMRDGQAVRLGDLAAEQGISLSYLEQIFARLREAELVEGIRGPGGGYRLSCHADEVTLADILDAVEEQADSNPANRLASPVQQMWQALSNQLRDFLDGITLASLLEKQALPRRSYQMGETASLIARMFPPRAASNRPGFATAAGL